jgi:peptidylprolyl isomerase
MGYHPTEKRYKKIFNHCIIPPNQYNMAQTINQPNQRTLDMTEANHHLTLTLKDGPVTIELRPDLAPKHVARFCELAAQGFYDGIVFHRVIDGFMAQTGDPTGTGTGGSGQNLKAEFSREPHKRGVLSMARAQNPDSADSQFFIVLADAPHLDNQYTVFGKVLSGMEHVDHIKKGAPGSGTVTGPDKIVSLKVVQDPTEAN